MKKYDSIIVGSGISGMTLAVLLGMNGNKVLLLEKSPQIGGAMARFHKKGIPFDTGFHFTGGFLHNGILHDMLSVLGIQDSIKPIYLDNEKSNRFVLDNEKVSYGISSGFQGTITKLKEYFPEESSSIEKYFDMLKDVCDRTASMDLRNVSVLPDVVAEDYISLDEVLNKLIKNENLKALLSGYCMCYGVKPSEISFANHSRVAYSMYESVVRIEKGGDAFIDAFKKKFKSLNIEIQCNSYIEECCDVKEKKIGHFKLNDGSLVTFDNCSLTVHPNEILKILPHEHLTKAFLSRVEAFEPSAGFFSVFGVAKSNELETNSYPVILSLFPTTNTNELMDPSYAGDPALVIMKNQEEVNGKKYDIINAFELSFAEHVNAWSDSSRGKRPKEYVEYKNKRTESIVKRLLQQFPEYKDSFELIASASMLTFKDYLNTPYGSAYGIKQKIGQFNLCGKLPIRNIYAAGQSAILPGIAGAMMSSFIVGRKIVGRDKYNNLIKEKLV